MIRATVLQVLKDEVLVDGLFGVSSVPRNEVTTAHLVSDSGAAGRRSTSDIRPGDVLSLRIVEPYTPYGDTLLAPVQASEEAQRAAVWAELRDAHALKEAVPGRVLNECPGGYAVGISGQVALMPYSQATLETTRCVIRCVSVGVWQHLP